MPGLGEGLPNQRPRRLVLERDHEVAFGRYRHQVRGEAVRGWM
jgi:hypothetical protein